jgi:hypothetical protein
MDLGKQLIVLEYRLELADILETATARETRPSRLLRRASTATGLILALALLSVPVVMKEVPDSLGAFLLGVLPLAVVMVVSPWYYSPERINRSHYRSFQFPICKIEIAENGVKETMEWSENFLLWKGFDSYSENKTQFVLSTGAVHHILPKRAIEPNKIQEFENLLRTKIPAKNE